MFHKVPNTPLAALRNVPYYLFRLAYLILLILFFLILFELLRTVSKNEVRKQPVEDVKRRLFLKVSQNSQENTCAEVSF